MSKFSCFATGREFRGIKASRRPAAPRQGSSGLGSALGLHCRAVRREERPKSQKQPPTDKQIPEAEPRKAIVPERRGISKQLPGPGKSQNGTGENQSSAPAFPGKGKSPTSKLRVSGCALRWYTRKPKKGSMASR